MVIIDRNTYLSELGELLVEQVQVADGGAINAKGVNKDLLCQEAH